MVKYLIVRFHSMWAFCDLLTTALIAGGSTSDRFNVTLWFCGDSQRDLGLRQEVD